MDITEQNEAFLEAVRNCQPLPENYTWATGAPNCPGPPPSPEQQHLSDIQRQIAERLERMMGHARGNLSLGKPAYTESDIVHKINQAEAAIATAQRYSNDVTRLPAFIELAALKKFLRAAPGVRPIQIKR